jgi:hypothetical protein
LIASSASASGVGGISRLSAFAVSDRSLDHIVGSVSAGTARPMTAAALNIDDQVQFRGLLD